MPERQLNCKSRHESIDARQSALGSSAIQKLNFLLHRERGGSRIPHPLGWGWSEPSPIFHVFLRLINRVFWPSDTGSQLFWSLDQMNLWCDCFWIPSNRSARPEAYPIPLGWGGRAQFDLIPVQWSFFEENHWLWAYSNGANRIDGWPYYRKLF